MKLLQSQRDLALLFLGLKPRLLCKALVVVGELSYLFLCLRQLADAGIKHDQLLDGLALLPFQLDLVLH